MFLHTLAHLGGRIFASLAGFIITMLITAKLGAAAMGVFGIYMVLQNFIAVLDGGMALTINRAMAIGAGDTSPDADHLRLFRTYEWINLGIGAVFTVVAAIVLPQIIHHWSSQTTIENIHTIGLLFGAALGVKFMQMLYQNTLFGAHRHLDANAVISLFAITRILLIGGMLIYGTDLCMVFALFFGLNTLELFGFIIACNRQGIWHLRTRPDFSLIKKYASFMAPVSAYTIVALLIAQVDRIVVGHFISLEQFGAYSLVAGYAAGVAALSYAPANVFYPTMTQAIHHADHTAAALAVRRVLNFILFLTFPAALWVVFYGMDLSHLLFKDTAVGAMTAPLWPPLFLACAISVLSVIPYKIFLAHQMPKLILKVNAIALIFYIALLVGSLMILKYPAGLMILPPLATIPLSLYLFYLARIGETEQHFVQQILLRSTATAAALSVFYMLAHTISAYAPRPLWQNLFALGWPPAVAALAYGSYIWHWRAREDSNL